MKTSITILVASVSLFIYTSCCKEPYPVAGINVSFPNLTNSETLKAKRTDKNNFSTVIDTIIIGELNTSNNYSAFIEFENEPPNYIIYIENTQHIDTISEILVERKGCKEKINNFQYKFNGQTKTDNELTIN